jgi:citrate lyase subunit beta / citryl-CoA lyase
MDRAQPILACDPAEQRGELVVVRADIPAWRSILFVPANVQKFLGKAKEHGADAILLDLEDSIAPSDKDSARTLLRQAVGIVGGGPADVGVRINRPLGLAIRDIEAAVVPGVSFLALPKVENAAHVKLQSEFVGECESRQGIARGTIRFLVNVESAEAFFRIEEIAKADARVVGLTLGGEDFSSSVGCEPSSEALLVPKQLALFAARAAGILPIGFVGSIANFSDLDEFRAVVRRSRLLGFVCGFAIHPSQVSILNTEFAPTALEIEHAQAVIELNAEKQAQGVGAFQYLGKMIDKPIVDRAGQLIGRARQLGLV